MEAGIPTPSALQRNSQLLQIRLQRQANWYLNGGFAGEGVQQWQLILLGNHSAH